LNAHCAAWSRLVAATGVFATALPVLHFVNGLDFSIQWLRTCEAEDVIDAVGKGQCHPHAAIRQGAKYVVPNGVSNLVQSGRGFRAGSSWKPERQNRFVRRGG
jgi:hypothetical protein